MTTALHNALTDLSDPPVRELPAVAAQLLVSVEASPRLAAHLRAVHDVAYQLTSWLGAHHRGLPFDRDAVLFGAATHDIGKAIHTAELSGPGSEHEATGAGAAAARSRRRRQARALRRHRRTWDRDDLELDDLLVSVADKVWKAKRVTDLEQRVLDRLAAASGQEAWQVFMDLDHELDRLAAGADHRLAFQNSYPISSSRGVGTVVEDG